MQNTVRGNRIPQITDHRNPLASTNGIRQSKIKTTPVSLKTTFKMCISLHSQVGLFQATIMFIVQKAQRNDKGPTLKQYPFHSRKNQYVTHSNTPFVQQHKRACTHSTTTTITQTPMSLNTSQQHSQIRRARHANYPIHTLYHASLTLNHVMQYNVH